MSDPVRSFRVDDLEVLVYPSNAALGQSAALAAREHIAAAVDARGRAHVILATGNSQLSFLRALRGLDGIAWEHVDVFHMDEYLGIVPDHPASFPMFLRKELLEHVSATFYPLPSRPEDVGAACEAYARLLLEHPADLVVLGFGENGHLAFNDPPDARFDDPAWVRVVTLDERSRQQQVGEGHFGRLDEVPKKAITLTIPALLAAKHMLCLVPEARKAEAVRDCLQEPISEARPGSVLRRAAHARLYLDLESAARLTL